MAYSVLNCYGDPDFQGNMVLGFLSMFIAFAFIFVGVKNYRDKYNTGQITFGKAFLIGLYISLIASTMYVVTWLFIYYLYIPDFMDKYAAHVLKEAHTNGATQAEITEKTASMESYKEMYKNPVMVVLLTYMEILPVGLLVSLVSAFIFWLIGYFKKRIVKTDSVN
ncbi:MAG: DUF4199 domain-containing protein [Sphingobacteriaceae bacterium]|nr:MAG: DUF4199 domain-containing protein [Sphingobacteriaceae bacterium]